MIDIHTHVLPAIDDGAKTPEDSIKMLADSFKQGVSVCVATPHAIIHSNDDIDEFVNRRKQAYESIKSMIDGSEYGLPKLLLGAEVYMDNNISVFEDISKLCIENTDYMLLELPINKNINKNTAEWVYELTLKGIKPIMAHIDRYVGVFDFTEMFSGLDVKYQVNAARLLSFGGRRFVKDLLKYDNTFVFSSDMHNLTFRKCNMQRAYNKAKKQIGDITDSLFMENANNLLKILK